MKEHGEIIDQAVGVKCRSTFVVESLGSATHHMMRTGLTLETERRGERAA
jgi:hypothetical protein